MTIKDIHNVADYVVGGALALSPFFSGFSDVGAPSGIFLFVGLGLFFYSLFTDYRFSLVKSIPLWIHIGIDILASAVLISAPFIMDYRHQITEGQLQLHFLFSGILVLMVILELFETQMLDLTARLRFRWPFEFARRHK